MKRKVLGYKEPRPVTPMLLQPICSAARATASRWNSRRARWKSCSIPATAEQIELHRAFMQIVSSIVRKEIHQRSWTCCGCNKSC